MSNTAGSLARPVTGLIRRTAEDFEVREILGFEPRGRGEHVLLQVCKRELNTPDVAQRIARLAGVAEKEVGYCGLKDRCAVATQWFSVRSDAGRAPVWRGIEDDRVCVVGETRHHRKLRRGAHKGNRFTIRARQVAGGRERVEAELMGAATDGVPNFFGPQRFGRRNLAQADAWFRGSAGRVSRTGRGILLSAARSSIFNEVLSRRVQRGDWNALRRGDAAMLDGSNSFFRVDEVDDVLQHRLREFDVHPSGPLFGAGDNPARHAIGALEAEVFDALRLRCEGLLGHGLRMARRSLRLRVRGLEWAWEDAETLALNFELDAGGYATAVLAAVGCFDDAGGRTPESERE